MSLPTANQVLNRDFWEAFRLSASGFNLDQTVSFLDNYTDYIALEKYCDMKYGDIPFFKELSEIDEFDAAGLAIMEMGMAFERIVSVIMAQYNPLENYFTDRNVETGTESSLTKSGKEVTTPSGKSIVTDKGKIKRSYDGSDTIGQGTTYDSATTTPDSSNDFYNISKTINNLTISEESDSQNPRAKETSFDQYKVERSFNDRKDEGESTETIEEHRSGNSGIFSKQDLSQREIDLRLRNKLVPILCRMVVSVFEMGVYHADD